MYVWMPIEKSCGIQAGLHLSFEIFYKVAKSGIVLPIAFAPLHTLDLVTAFLKEETQPDLSHRVVVSIK